MTQLTPAEYVSLTLFLIIWYTFEPLPNARSRPQFSGRPTGRQARFFYALRASLGSLNSGAIFGIVWFIMYGLIAVSLFVFWRDPVAQADSRYTTTLILYLVNLFVNKVWSPIFFGLQQPGWAMVDLVLVLGTAVAIQVLVGLVVGAGVAFWLFIWYVVWLLVATFLNVRFLVKYGEVTDEEALGKLAKGFGEQSATGGEGGGQGGGRGGGGAAQSPETFVFE